MKKLPLPIVILLVTCVFSSCAVIGEILTTPVGFGVFIVIGVFVVTIVYIMQIGRGRN